jgi:phosphatidylserine decarboxylase
MGQGDLSNRQRAFMSVMKWVPKATLSRVVGAGTRLPVPATLHQTVARLFSRAYHVEVDEAERPLGDYPTFGDFFTRRLKPGLRPVAEGERVVVSPVDGTVSECGLSTEGQLVQAKGMKYTLGALLADEARAAKFRGGAWATIYLAPRDYHRIHAPLAGKVTGYAYVPGAFWPVNPASVLTVPDLFAANERLITFMDTAFGEVAVVKVGATCVGRIRATYDDVVTHTGQGARTRTYEHPIAVEKGGEVGVFEMGSTVILAFEPGRVTLDARIVPGTKLRMGEAIGLATATRPAGAGA